MMMMCIPVLTFFSICEDQRKDTGQLDDKGNNNTDRTLNKLALLGFSMGLCALPIMALN